MYLLILFTNKQLARPSYLNAPNIVYAFKCIGQTTSNLEQTQSARKVNDNQFKQLFNYKPM